MDTLRKINMPEPTITIAAQVLDFLTTFIPYSVVFGIFWKTIDAVLKYASEGRDSRTRTLIHEVTEPMNNNMKKLTESIWELSRKIDDKK